MTAGAHGATEGAERLSALPSPRARALAFAGICVGGLLGLLIGYGVTDVLSTGSPPVPLVIGAMLGAAAGAGGASVLAVLALRASPEWRRVDLDTPLRPADTPLRSADTPLRSADTPLRSADTPLRSADTPLRPAPQASDPDPGRTPESP